MTPETMTPAAELAFPFLHANDRPAKPRARGITESVAPTTRSWVRATSTTC